MSSSKIPDRDMAIIYKIHLGVTRDGRAVLDSTKVENVLGDVPHKDCLGAFAMLASLLLQEMLNKHFGDGMSEEEAKDYVRGKAVEEDLDLSFFDQNTTIGSDD